MARPLTSCLYPGAVMHRRLRPVTHRFSYRIFSMLLDLDELGTLDRRTAFFGHNRWRLFSFHDRDHGPRDGSPLRPWIEARLGEAGIDIAGGSVQLLCFPRILGYVFNPLSIWFCRDRRGTLAAILYEVSNTFGERHGYLIPVEPGRAPHEPVSQSCEKGFYVSPFIDLAGRYRFRLAEPGARLSIAISEEDADGTVMVAAQTGRRQALTGARLLGAFLAYPLMTLKVMAAIHWEALRLWRKGARFHKRPAPPAEAVTVVAPDGAV